MPQGFLSRSAQSARIQSEHERWQRRPKYARGLVWAEDDSEAEEEHSAYSTATLAEWTETAQTWRGVPPSEALNLATFDTISSHRDLFAIVTPIKVDVFENYLADHPNQDLVKFICHGLREGFWPNACAPSNYPVTVTPRSLLVVSRLDSVTTYCPGCTARQSGSSPRRRRASCAWWSTNPREITR